MGQKLNTTELFHFCEQFSFILRSGMSAAEGLQILIDDCDVPARKKELESIASHFDICGSLYESLEESHIFPSSMTAYVKVGEETGCLDEIMDSLSTHYKLETEITEHVRHAVTYPILMLGMMGAVIAILLVKVLPVFQQVFRQMGLEMNEFSTGLLKISEVFNRNAGVFLGILACFIVLMLFFSFHPAAKKRLKTITSKMPYFRDIALSMDYGRLTHGIALGLRSGLGPEISLELACSLISHPVVKNRLMKTLELLSDGSGFCEALTDSQLFSGMDARLITIGFHAGASDEVMNRLAARYRENAVSILGQIISVIEPTIVIILSVLVGIVLLSVMMPLLGILSNVII